MKHTTKKKIIGSKVQVFRGHAVHTKGGLKKHDIIKKKVGPKKYRYISKKKHDKMKHNPWANAVKKARTNLKLKGFVPLKGAFLAEARRVYGKKTKKKTKKKKTKKKKIKN